MVSRKDCTVKSSTEKRKRIGKKWNRTAHLLETYIAFWTTWKLS